MRSKTVITSLLRIAKKYRGWKYNFKFWKSALIKKLGGKYALHWKVIWSSVKCVKILSVTGHNSPKNLSSMNYLLTCTSRLVVQHLCQVSFKSMQGCRRSWEDKLKCVKILSVKDYNSAKICGTWITSPHALLDLWCNIPAKFHSNPCKDVGGVEKTSLNL